MKGRELPQVSPMVAAVELSENAKIGPSHATYVTQDSCPACPLKGSGCYAEHGNMAFVSRRLNKASAGQELSPEAIARAEADAIAEKLSGRLDLRLHVVGDCKTSEAAHIVSEAALKVLKNGRDAWTYTHAWRDVDRSAWGRLSALASCEKPAQVSEAQERGYATALVIPEFQSDKKYDYEGVQVIPCPSQTREVRCVDCRLCFDDKRLRDKNLTIGFEAHGSRFKVVRRVIAA
jgi:hypothetical protein